MAGLTPLTELEAINEILATGSDSPISTLEENTVIDASLAMNTLRATSVEVQTRGWNFNTEESLKITPDQEGAIRLPRNTLKVDTVGESAGINGVQRGLRLYNKTDKTYTFGSPVTVDLVLGLDFEELPSTARLYITIRAARKYQDRYFGDQSTHSYTSQDELTAQSVMMGEELESTDPNMLTGSQFNQDLRNRG
ncbi:phage tail protein [Sinorhizobium medicae]|uniref:phage tail protein n=1 Tax=Sinorhizobium medicae TaxID=110321 RepID=UPI000FD87FC5|nr:phage tail protein [Sinorhizobium medicae]RVH82049.1 phage tail protein [Sinorhizobium medicae]RVP63875.1 phage tail protein [Sinorhizobium medicae]